MNRDAWFIFLGLAVAGLAAWLGFAAWQKRVQLSSTRMELERAQAAATAQAARLNEAWAEVKAAREHAEELAKAVVEASSAEKRLEQDMRAALESRDIAISELQGKLTLTILDRILFDSGEAQLKPEGNQVLDEIARVLSRYTNRHVQVIGHTDNVPIRVRYPSNWELSAARALAAVRYLTEKAGVDPKRLSAVGCGEFQPLADNATPEGRAKNRRIAVVVLPETFAGADTAPGLHPPANVTATNEAPTSAIPLPLNPTNVVPGSKEALEEHLPPVAVPAATPE